MFHRRIEKYVVSILVLMELCIKTIGGYMKSFFVFRFNPCFNGTMYKNSAGCLQTSGEIVGFNPCFNGTMYKN